jgi:hypothetical protein
LRKVLALPSISSQTVAGPPHTERRALIALQLSNSSSPISMRFVEEKRRLNFCKCLSDGFIEHDDVHGDELWSLIQLADMDASVIFA